MPPKQVEVPSDSAVQSHFDPDKIVMGAGPGGMGLNMHLQLGGASRRSGSAQRPLPTPAATSTGSSGYGAGGSTTPRGGAVPLRSNSASPSNRRSGSVASGVSIGGSPQNSLQSRSRQLVRNALFWSIEEIQEEEQALSWIASGSGTGSSIKDNLKPVLLSRFGPTCGDVKTAKAPPPTLSGQCFIFRNFIKGNERSLGADGHAFPFDTALHFKRALESVMAVIRRDFLEKHAPGAGGGPRAAGPKLEVRDVDDPLPLHLAKQPPEVIQRVFVDHNRLDGVLIPGNDITVKQGQVVDFGELVKATFVEMYCRNLGPSVLGRILGGAGGTAVYIGGSEDKTGDDGFGDEGDTSGAGGGGAVMDYATSRGRRQQDRDAGIGSGVLDESFGDVPITRVVFLPFDEELEQVQLAGISGSTLTVTIDGGFNSALFEFSTQVLNRVLSSHANKSANHTANDNENAAPTKASTHVDPNGAGGNGCAFTLEYRGPCDAMGRLDFGGDDNVYADVFYREVTTRVAKAIASAARDSQFMYASGKAPPANCTLTWAFACENGLVASSRIWSRLTTTPWESAWTYGAIRVDESDLLNLLQEVQKKQDYAGKILLQSNAGAGGRSRSRSPSAKKDVKPILKDVSRSKSPETPRRSSRNRDEDKDGPPPKIPTEGPKLRQLFEWTRSLTAARSTLAGKLLGPGEGSLPLKNLANRDLLAVIQKSFKMARHYLANNLVLQDADHPFVSVIVDPFVVPTAVLGASQQQGEKAGSLDEYDIINTQPERIGRTLSGMTSATAWGGTPMGDSAMKLTGGTGTSLSSVLSPQFFFFDLPIGAPTILRLPPHKSGKPPHNILLETGVGEGLDATQWFSYWAACKQRTGIFLSGDKASGGANALATLDRERTIGFNKWAPSNFIYSPGLGSRTKNKNKADEILKSSATGGGSGGPSGGLSSCGSVVRGGLAAALENSVLNLQEFVNFVDTKRPGLSRQACAGDEIRIDHHISAFVVSPPFELLNNLQDLHHENPNFRRRAQLGLEHLLEELTPAEKKLSDTCLKSMALVFVIHGQTKTHKLLFCGDAPSSLIVKGLHQIADQAKLKKKDNRYQVNMLSFPNSGSEKNSPAQLLKAVTADHYHLALPHSEKDLKAFVAGGSGGRTPSEFNDTASQMTSASLGATSTFNDPGSFNKRLAKKMLEEKKNSALPVLAAMMPQSRVVIPQLEAAARRSLSTGAGSDIFTEALAKLQVSYKEHGKHYKHLGL